MKTKYLLVASVGLNVLLAFVYWSSRPEASRPEATEVETLTRAEGAASSAETTAEPNVITNTITRAGRDRVIDWRAVESADYKEYIANLRAIGCPEETIQDILIADVEKLFKSRRSEAAQTNKFEYWKIGNPLAGFLDAASVDRSQKAAEEKRALLKELLGVELNRPELAATINPYESMDFLSPEQSTALMELDQKYAAKLLDTLKSAQQGDPSAMNQVQRDKDAELEALMGPEAKLEYDLRLSQTAVVMRMKLTEFQPSEEEFRQLFQLQKSFDDEYGIFGNAPKDQATRAQWDQAKVDLEAQAKTFLGEDRYREYHYDRDWSTSSLRGVSEEFNVPKDQALRVFDLKQPAQEQAQRLRSDTALSAAERQRGLDSIRQATEEELTRLIGRDAASAYIEKGSWIKGLSR